MFDNFENTTLGIWAAHGEGKIVFDKENDYNIVESTIKAHIQPTPMDQVLMLL